MFDDVGLPIQKKCVVAFVDLLGVSHKIEIDSQWALDWVWLFYKSITQEIKQHENVKFKIFSDNILICREIDEDNSKQCVLEIIEVLDKIEELMFTAKAIFIRGAVVVDDLHFSDNFVYGKALVRAYELENKYAVYPRVVIDNSALELINDEKLPIVQDKDGLYFYDYIQFCIIENKEEWLKKIRTFKFNVLLNIRGNLTNASVLNKMEWAVNYYNDNCIRHNIKYLITYKDLKECGVNVSYIHIVPNLGGNCKL